VNRFERQARDALDATAVLPPLSFTWLGQTPAPRALPSAPCSADRSVREALVDALTHHLYLCFYAPGTVVLDMPRSGRAHVGRTPFVDELSRANGGRWSMQGGWRIVERRDGCTVVSRAGLRVWASDGEIEATTDAPPRTGAEVALRLPRESVDALPGFYVAFGERDVTAAGPQGLVRYYWNVSSVGAVRLTALLTRALNAREIGFRLKAISDPGAYQRADAVVLYVSRRDRALVDSVAGDVSHALRNEMGAAVPAFTLLLAPGLGFAEDPGTGESFGIHRCALLAEAIVRGAEHGLRSLEGRVALTRQVFAEAGVNLLAPYLGPPAAVGIAT